MKSTKEYISLLQQHAHVLREKYGVTSLSLFGSVARGEQQEGSDVDVLVEMPPSLRAVGGANLYLENILGCHVDMIRNHKRLTPFFRKQIERDAVTIFWIDLDDAFVLSVIQNDLEPLLNAVDYLMKELEIQRTGLEVDASLDTK